MVRVVAVHRVLVVLGVVALLAALVPQASAQTSGCGEVVPVSEVEPGMVGQGLTVSQGTEPEPFEVEVLGVLEDGVGLDRDMIIVEVDSPALQRAGGIWQGMSGSPVYVGDRLLGAVAYGLSFVSTTIGGLTPAEDMVELLDLPAGDAAFAEAQAEAARTATVTGELAAEIARRTGRGPAFAQDGVTLQRLALPLSVSGVSPDRLELVQRAADAAGLDVRAHVGSSAFLQTGAAAPQPGDNLAVAQSLGDLTAAAVGTTTLVCDGRAVGFGHPFALTGSTTAGAAAAEAITIIPDPGFAPFKLANIGALFGTVDQDRFAGVRADLAGTPAAIPVRSDVADLDTDRSRRGRTDVLTPDQAPFLAAFHLLANVDTVIDRIGPGGATLAYTIRGAGERSGPFELVREDRFVSEFDIGFESIFPLLDDAAQVALFPGEAVTLEDISIEAAYQEQIEAYGIDEVRLGVDGAPPLAVDGAEVVVRPGSVLAVQVDLTGQPDGATRTVDLEVVVPDDAYGFGSLAVGGGDVGDPGLPEECLFDPSLCGGGAEETVQDVVERIASRPRGDELTARLDVQRIGDPAEPTPPPAEEPTEQPTEEPAEPEAGFTQLGEPVLDREQLDRVVQGLRSVGLAVDSPYCPDCPVVVNRVAGGDRVETAALLAGYAFGFAETVVVAPADDYPAALVAGPYAARLGAPVLLTDGAALSPPTADAIAGLGARTAIVVAPDGQLGAPVEEGLRAAGIEVVDRVGGADRYALAAAVASRMGGTRAWLVQGESADPARGWPDAVSAGPVAAYEGAPILLTRTDDLPGPTTQAISAQGITAVAIAGGTAAVGTGVEAQLAGAGVAVERVAGVDRFDTSRLLAERAVALGACPCNTWLVTGGAFPDALAATPAVAWTAGVALLVHPESLGGSPATGEWLQALRGTGPLITLVGGPAAISPQVEQEVVEVLSVPGGGGGEPEPIPVDPVPGGAAPAGGGGAP